MLEWGVIQAGGKSARMGRDKAWLEIGKKTLIEHGLSALRPVAERLAIVISEGTPAPERYAALAATWQADLLVDRHGFLGPLGGIQTALAMLREASARDQAAAILACDLPFLPTALLAHLAEIHRTGDFALTLPEDAQGRPQPLAAIYSLRCLPAVEQLLADRRLRVDGLYPLVRTRRVRYDEYRTLFASDEDAQRSLTNLNTRDDVARIAPR
ncbi:MAG: molybdenum cofactor guanylyltransferase [Blastocatellia bacterium]|nr:molybdenum cofactor guanylyltransferase [Blastocatellia bacterium]